MPNDETPEDPEPGGDASASSGPEGSGEHASAPDKKPRPRSRGGRRPPPDHLPEDDERHDVCACGYCGGRVFKRDVLETRVYTVVPSYVRCRHIKRERVICADPSCNQPTTAPMPPMPCDRALYDCRFLAWIVVMKFVLLVPLDRIRLLLQSQGVDIAMSTLVYLIERAATLCDPIDGEHMKQLRAGAWMCFDGTGLKTLVLGQDKAWDGYLEVYTRDELTCSSSTSPSTPTGSSGASATSRDPRLRRRDTQCSRRPRCDPGELQRAPAPQVPRRGAGPAPAGSPGCPVHPGPLRARARGRPTRAHWP